MNSLPQFRSFDAVRSSDPIRVLKFGSSLLRSVDDIPAICDEIGHHLREVKKLVVVVSAFRGETDDLLGLARRLSSDPCPALLPRLVLSGEERAACMVALACRARGIETELIPIADLGLRASGDPLSSTPRSLDHWAIAQALEQHDVVVVPGFGAQCETTGRHVLLGRGGSDLTAAMIAGALKLRSFRLIKDVDGIYTQDPKLGSASRLRSLDWDEMKRLGGKVVQREAIECAERLGVRIEVAALGSDDPSVIGPAVAEE
jgi:homoserine dehydrogenase